MKFESDKVFSLINKHESSLSAFAPKIGMSHSGLKTGLVKGTLGVQRLIKIAMYFNKPIGYFFEDEGWNAKGDISTDVEEKSTTNKDEETVSSYKNDPELEKRVEKLENYFELIKLSRDVDEFIKKLDNVIKKEL